VENLRDKNSRVIQSMVGKEGKTCRVLPSGALPGLSEKIPLVLLARGGAQLRF